MRKALIIGLLVCGLIGGGAFWVLNSPWLSVRIARRAIATLLPGARVTELSVGRQRCDGFVRLAWDNLRVRIGYQGRMYHVTVAQLTVFGLPSLAQAKSSLGISLTGADVSFSPGEAKDLKADLSVSLERRKVLRLEGPVTAAGLKWDKIAARQISFRLSGDLESLEFNDIRAMAYGGTIAGGARFQPRGAVYSVDMTIDGVETARLSDVNEQLSSQVAGRVNSHIRISGHAGELVSLEGNGAMRNGAKVNASLLSFLAQYIPQSEEKKRLEALIKKGGQLPVEVLACTIKSATPRHLGGEVTLKSREVNLEVNLSNEINTDGTLMALLEYWKTIFK